MLVYILLGYFISNLITLIVFMATDEDEDKTLMTSLGFAWIFVLLIKLFVKITKWTNAENEAKRIEKAAKKLLKKEKITYKDWKNFYDKQSKKSSNAWNVFRKTETNKQLEARGYGEWKEAYWDMKYLETNGY